MSETLTIDGKVAWKLNEFRHAGQVAERLPNMYSRFVGRLPGHMQHAFAEWIFFGRLGGDFMTAVIENNLVDAHSRADSVNFEAISTYAMWLYNDAPGGSWNRRPGSVEKWEKAGGLVGQLPGVELYEAAGLVRERAGEVTMGKVEMKAPERSLLLYLECCATDYTGRIDPRHLNAADFRVLGRWDKDGFLQYGRIEFEKIRAGRTHWVRLSDAAHEAAYQLRRDRAERTWEAREWRTTTELHGGEHVK